MRKHSQVYVVAALLVVVSVQWRALIVPDASGQQSSVLVGSGSALPEALYLDWIQQFHFVSPAIQLRYLPLGTQESIRQVLSGVSDFGGGDGPIQDTTLKQSRVQMLELPTAIVGVAIVCNVPGVAGEVSLSGPVVADIFLSKITSWNDPEIAKLNPGVKLPALAIMIVHFTDGKGTNYILTDYLSATSPEFRARVGKSFSPKWPIGMGLARSEEVLQMVQDTPGAIGYAEVGAAEKNGALMAAIRNTAGEFVKPSKESMSASAAAMDSSALDDGRVSLVNAPGKESYPICSLTWLYVPAKPKDPYRGRALVTFLDWIFTTGQAFTARQGAAPLPPQMLARVHAKIASIH
jgi:phosphate transport system substrate-binding protein